MGRSSWVTTSQHIILTSNLPAYTAAREIGQAGVKNPARESLFNKILCEIAQDDPNYLSKQKFNGLGYGGTLEQREKAFIGVRNSIDVLTAILTHHPSE